MKRVLVLIACMGALPMVGCVSSEQLAARDDATCQSYGLRYGTDGYASCRTNVAQQRQQAYMQFATAMQRNAAQQQAANAQLMQTYMQNTRPAAPTNTTTTCMGLGGNMVSCNSTTN
jgi:hypothetical protein